MTVTWPLVGRDEEVALLAGTLETGAGSGFVLSGRAGVGKTRLALEVAERAEAAGRDVEWLVATHGTSRIALGALAPMLGEPPPLVSEGELLHWARQRIAARSGVVLCVDDAHLLDDASASILVQLAARREAFVVATIRSGEPCPDGVADLWEGGWAERVEVLPLGRTETTALARDFLGADLTPPTSERFFEMSRGVPLYLRELLLASAEEGSITDTGDGRKHWQGPFVPSERLTDLVTARLARLDDNERDATLAVALGEPIDLRTAECVVDRAVVGGIEARGLVTTERAADRPVLRMAHPLYGEVLRETLPITQSRTLYGRLADAADEVGYPDDDLLRVATWRLECDDHGDPERLLAAGQRALRTSDFELAQRLGHAATDAGGGPRAQLLIADALYFANRWDEAAASLDALATADLDDDTRADAAIRRSSMLIWWAGDPAAANDVLAEAAAEINDPARRAEVDSERVWPFVVGDRLDEAITVAEPYMAEDAPHRRATVRAIPPSVVAYTIGGRTRDALGIAERGAGLVTEMADALPAVQGELLTASCFALWLDGLLLDAEALVRSAFADGAEDWSDGGRGLFGFIEGKAALERGHAQRAFELIKPAIDALRSDDIGNFLPWAFYVLARTQVLRGETDAAWRAIRDGDAHRRPAVRLAEPDRAFATAAASEADEPGAGRELLADTVRDFESWGAFPYALLALTDAVRFGRGERSDAARASELAGRCQGTLAPALAFFVRGVVQRDAGELNAVAQTLGAAGVDVVAAEAALLAAELFEDDGRRGAALGARQQAASLLERCGPVRTRIVATSATDLPVAQLTKRELEVAQLVGLGLTNREIAHRLHVSERTIGNHVQSIFTKLGVNDRRDLRALT